MLRTLYLASFPFSFTPIVFVIRRDSDSTLPALRIAHYMYKYMIRKRGFARNRIKSQRVSSGGTTANRHMSIDCVFIVRASEHLRSMDILNSKYGTIKGIPEVAVQAGGFLLRFSTTRGREKQMCIMRNRRLDNP